ncbi:MAG: hypothetical protein AAF514_09165 [Verrucomicrobiota bacterium]
MKPLVALALLFVLPGFTGCEKRINPDDQLIEKLKEWLVSDAGRGDVQKEMEVDDISPYFRELKPLTFAEFSILSPCWVFLPAKMEGNFGLLILLQFRVSREKAPVVPRHMDVEKVMLCHSQDYEKLISAYREVIRARSPRQRDERRARVREIYHSLRLKGDTEEERLGLDDD